MLIHYLEGYTLKMSNVYCSVFGCNSKQKRNPEISFHTFPKQGAGNVTIQTKSGNSDLIDRRLAWVLRLKIGKRVSNYMKVCSRHFKKSDYFYRSNESKQRPFLKKTAVPSLHLPSVKHGNVNSPTESTPGPSELRSKRVENRNRLKEANQTASLDSSEIHHHCLEEENDDNHTEDELNAAECLMQLLTSQPNYGGPKSFRDFEVQVNTMSAPTLSSLITNDSALNSLTGLNSFKMLNAILEAVQTFYADIRIHKLTIKDRIILTFVKLKCNLTYSVLAILFGVKLHLCSDYIKEMLPILSAALEPLIFMPDGAEIQKNLPKCFANYRNTRIVIDCTEVSIQTPKCLCCRIRFYSQYKGGLTVKIMICISPAGLITFVSKVFGGRASDKTIFEQSDLILKCMKGDAVMVDKGFLIDDVCSKFGIDIYRPAFLKQKGQLSTEESLSSTEISKARVHIERVNQRIKIFKILNGPLPLSLLRHVDDIFTIICGVTNISAPILSDVKF